MKWVDTYWATIYVGLREGYDGPVHAAEEAELVCRAYCDEVGLCVSLKPTRFVYRDGAEDGVEIGLIHYPRFPHADPSGAVRHRAFELASRLLEAMGQLRVSVVFPDETVMMERS